MRTCVHGRLSGVPGGRRGRRALRAGQIQKSASRRLSGPLRDTGGGGGSQAPKSRRGKGRGAHDVVRLHSIGAIGIWGGKRRVLAWGCGRTTDGGRAPSLRESELVWTTKASDERLQAKRPDEGCCILEARCRLYGHWSVCWPPREMARSPSR